MFARRSLDESSVFGRRGLVYCRTVSYLLSHLIPIVLFHRRFLSLRTPLFVRMQWLDVRRWKCTKKDFL